ncbi:unnamed protein product, partial [Rangifer tarandus platyrhynchus]
GSRRVLRLVAAHKRRWNKIAGDTDGAMHSNVAACCRPETRCRDATPHRAVGTPSGRDKYAVLAVECLVYGIFCNLSDQESAHISVLTQLTGMSWQREDFLHRGMSVRSKTTVLPLHGRPNALSSYTSFRARLNRNNRAPPSRSAALNVAVLVQRAAAERFATTVYTRSRQYKRRSKPHECNVYKANVRSLTEEKGASSLSRHPAVFVFSCACCRNQTIYSCVPLTQCIFHGAREAEAAGHQTSWRHAAQSDPSCVTPPHVPRRGPHVPFRARRNRNNRTPSVVYCRFERCGPCTANGR